LLPLVYCLIDVHISLKVIKGGAFYLFCLTPTMAHQLQAKKELLIIGDSNIERNILHTGRLYCELAESVPARNLQELSMAVGQIQNGKHKVVVFAMLTNLIINAGNTVTAIDLPPRLVAVEACLKSLLKDIA
jgi:ribosomal protein L30E